MTIQPRRRWFPRSFGLRTLLVLVTIIAAGCAFVAWHMRLVSQRVTQASLVWSRGGRLDRLPENLKLSPAHAAHLPTFAWQWFGDVPCFNIRIKAGSMTPEEEEQLAAAFPEADIYADNHQADRPQDRVRIIQDRTISETLARARRADAFD
jgi:hypothetical protein